MKYCSRCGCELNDNDAFCPKCGTRASDAASSSYTQYSNSGYTNTNTNNTKSNNDTLLKVAFGFGVASIVICVLYFFIAITISLIAFAYLIPLCYALPMTIMIYKAMKDPKYKLSLAFKICYLLFVSLVSGICLLCMKEDKN